MLLFFNWLLGDVLLSITQVLSVAAILFISCMVIGFILIVIFTIKDRWKK